LDKEVVTELIQSDFNKKRLKEELSNVLVDSNRTELFIAYYDLEKKLGGIGASKKTAQLIVEAAKT
jgi:lipid-A-disaccharide synthase